VIDVRGLHAVTRKISYPTTRIEDILNKIQNAQYYTTLDFSAGHWQIPMAEEISLFTFICREGTFAPTVIPFGLTNAPAVFIKLPFLQGWNLETGIREPVAEQFILVSLDDFTPNLRLEIPNIQSVGRISKFSTFRPKQCKWPGQRGHYRVCVCQIHENYRLMKEVFLVPLSTQELASKLLCNNPNDECFMGFCDLCPKQEQVEALFHDLEEEEVEINQWRATDATTLETLKESKEDFQNRFHANIPKILEHRRINIRQKAFIDTVKKERIMDRKSVCVTVELGPN
jgi:hypothetical protein